MRWAWQRSAKERACFRSWLTRESQKHQLQTATRKRKAPEDEEAEENAKMRSWKENSPRRFVLVRHLPSAAQTCGWFERHLPSKAQNIECVEAHSIRDERWAFLGDRSDDDDDDDDDDEDDDAVHGSGCPGASVFNSASVGQTAAFVFCGTPVAVGGRTPPMHVSVVNRMSG